MITPPFLKPGDKIAISCPAKKLLKPMDDAIKLLKSWGFEIICGDTTHLEHHQFAGTDELRAKEFQKFIDDASVKAIIAARGGYGCIRIVDLINFKPLIKNPKWIVGFSDITVFHLHLQNLGLQSLHAQMPSTISDSSKNGLKTLKMALLGDSFGYNFPSSTYNKIGEANAQLVGGNLTLIAACINSASDFSFDNKILFLEDVGEYFYAVDRMLRTLDRAGKFSKLKGLIVGSFTEMKDNEIPFGYSLEEIVLEIVAKYNFPICFNFPAGHINDNQTLVLGKEIYLKINDKTVNINY